MPEQQESEELKLNEWIVDESTGSKTMYTRLQNVSFCKTHEFDKNHECGRCPYKFTGFKAHEHIQKEDGIYSRKTNVKIA